MGGALAQRWEALGICEQLVIVDPASEQVKSSKDIPADFKPSVTVFAVKPQVLPVMIDDYKSYGGLVVSIVAGKPLSFFEKHLGEDARVVRSMPNNPAAIGKGITVACANKNVSTREKGRATLLLGAVGQVLWVGKESLLNPITALSGSGPAYVFLLIETLTKAGIHVGLDPVMAEELARQTVIGSAALAEENASTSAAKLRETVTSPGGTTEAALEVLMKEPGIQDLFDRALATATRRAEELAG